MIQGGVTRKPVAQTGMAGSAAARRPVVPNPAKSIDRRLTGMKPGGDPAGGEDAGGRGLGKRRVVRALAARGRRACARPARPRRRSGNENACRHREPD